MIEGAILWIGLIGEESLTVSHCHSSNKLTILEFVAVIFMRSFYIPIQFITSDLFHLIHIMQYLFVVHCGIKSMYTFPMISVYSILCQCAIGVE